MKLDLQGTRKEHLKKENSKQEISKNDAVKQDQEEKSQSTGVETRQERARRIFEKLTSHKEHQSQKGSPSISLGISDRK